MSKTMEVEERNKFLVCSGGKEYDLYDLSRHPFAYKHIIERLVAENECQSVQLGIIKFLAEKIAHPNPVSNAE